MSKYILITGLIAQGALAKTAAKIKEISLEVMPLKCTVAALMSTDFIARELLGAGSLSGEEIIVIPGLCTGPLERIQEATGCKVLKGPKDLTDLPAFFQSGPRGSQEAVSLPTRSPIRILAEIVDAPRMSLKQILEKAFYYRNSGADIIDLGGDIHQPFPDLAKVIKALKGEGLQVSIDSHQKEDILAASAAGVDLVLSLTSQNIDIAKVLSCPAVVIPDDGVDLASLYHNMEKLEHWHVPYLVDPILPPLTLGLAQGIERYIRVRRDHPDCEMLMGLGNVTELVDADSTGINALMVGIAGELQIHYLLTTEVSHRARGSVREISLARRLMHRAITEERVPKHLDDSLLTIKDPAGNSFGEPDLLEMQKVVRDKNFRIFVDDQIYLFNAHCFLRGSSAQELFSQLEIENPKHAFYLGQELGKAEIALGLGKRYVQDDPLRWGYLNQDETKKRGSLDDY
ncbi:DUF6513 domain-containing protein [Candidatus Formimonas warabiya]|uniref:Pterin-binding domain-containing protein n=1 Tax=Formimonas warabiya TaxID=1761012 RepID=A0A3G1KNP5_FORW1|nr:DUF6513 domain-containing protein [Candidatus Formimonas warabiya]ATW24040.1 hypothetical protein DCMF_03870 [Candidatus Formimonas warabiya]